MGRPDSGAIDRAVISVLQADAALAALMPDGVWFNRAGQGLTRFVLVGFQAGVDDGVYGQVRASEERRYAVQAIGLARDIEIDAMKAAALRIDELLADAPLPVPPDFGAIDCIREEPLAEDTEDEVDHALHWYHFGGIYVVTAWWPDPLAVVSEEDLHHVD